MRGEISGVTEWVRCWKEGEMFLFSVGEIFLVKCEMFVK